MSSRERSVIASRTKSTLWAVVCDRLALWERMAFERHVDELYQSFGDISLSSHADRKQVVYEFLTRFPTLVSHFHEYYESRRFSYETFSLIVRPSIEQIVACGRRLAGTDVSDESVVISSRDALRDFYRSEQGYLQQRLWLTLRLLEVISELIAEVEEFSGLRKLLLQRGLQDSLQHLLEWSGDPRVTCALLKALIVVQRVAGVYEFEHSWKTTIARCREWAASRTVDTWVRTAALKLLLSIDAEYCGELMMRILLSGSGVEGVALYDRQGITSLTRDVLQELATGEADDVFLKASIFETLASVPGAFSFEDRVVSLGRVCTPYVRQALARFLAFRVRELSLSGSGTMSDQLEGLISLIEFDVHPSVQAYALQSLSELAMHGYSPDSYLCTILALLRGDEQRLDIESMPQLLVRTIHSSLRHFIANNVKKDVADPISRSTAELLSSVAERLGEIRAASIDTSSTSLDSYSSHRLPEWHLREITSTLDVFWLQGNGQRCDFRTMLLRKCHSTRIGRRFRVAHKDYKSFSKEDLYRILKTVAEDDVGFDVTVNSLGMWVRRGFQMRRQWWRIRHELLTPSPDKRQAYAHTKARLVTGELRFPSLSCAEVTMARVPGEPVLFRDEGSWRPSLPLLADVLCATRKAMLGKSFPQVEIVSGDTITSVGVCGRWSGFRAWCRLSKGYGALALLRQRKRPGSEPFSDYLEALDQIGVRVAVQPNHADYLLSSECEPSKVSAVTRAGLEKGVNIPVDVAEGASLSKGTAFGGLASLAVLPVTIRDWFSTGLVSVSELPLQLNVSHLCFFIILLVGFFVAAYVWECKRTQRIRRAIPMVIGGWGSRGKSGTERLKAALFSGLGLSVVSKSTGCEAMMVVGKPFTDPHEIPLYRTYDKATIWEQRDVLSFTGAFQPEVFLWECMALTPAYVRVLQHGWMRDDFATVTNTYPDHEDIQGPSGIDVARTISEFIPRNSNVLTSEEQMVPFLSEVAKERQSKFSRTGWFEAGILTEDVLERFPYLEHPYNIGLVLGLADELGIERGVALKEMADRVIADLGVLKTTAVASIKGRTLEFTNGMSANERTGCLNNWYATGFANQDMHSDPGTYLVTVVNNRADRPARSRVFGQIITNDLSADLHVLIGTNLNGLLGILREEWEIYSASVKMEIGEEGSNLVGESLRAEAIKLRLFVNEAMVKKRVGEMIKRLDSEGISEGIVAKLDDATEISLEELIARLELAASKNQECVWLGQVVDYLEVASKQLTTFDKLFTEAKVVNEGSIVEFRVKALSFFTEEFFKKIVVVSDREATGDQIINTVAENVPVGLNARVMGIQNIKGVGMDFVLQWYRWDTFAQLCSSLERCLLQGASVKVVERGLQSIIDLGGFNLLMRERLLPLLSTLRSSSYVEQGSIDQKMKWIEAVVSGDAVVNTTIARVDESRRHRYTKGVLKVVGKLLESNRSVYRKLSARRTYAKLLKNQISYEDSRAHLWKLYKEQENGWLS